MKRLLIDINDEEHERLKEIAEERGMTVATFLGAFVQDLTDCGRREGSDEYARAWDWVNRNNFKYR